MARATSKTKIAVAALLLLAILVAVLIAPSTGDSPGHSRLHLPVGNGTPAISLGERHGLILASDGSLWSWGSDFLGSPVLGLGNLTNQSTSLRRVGDDTNWVGISASADHNLAVKLDGTLWTWGESVGLRLAWPAAIHAPVPAAAGNDWKQAAAGGIASFAVKKDGSLWGWGNNWAGSVGIPATNGSSAPIEIGSATNWARVWAGILETVALQSDGTLWYWGENPDPAFAEGRNQIFTPTRVNADTNWVDVGFAVNTVLAIKSDGTLWAWGRNAEVFTGAADQSQDATPARVGTDADWQSISDSTWWWCKGLTKKDGSLWFMDASQDKSNGPRPPYQQGQFRRIEFRKDCVAYAAGAAHAAAPGIHGPVGVILTRDGEVWTWGMVLGDPPTFKHRFQVLASKVAAKFHFKISPGDPDPIYRDEPWQLPNIVPDAPGK